MVLSARVGAIELAGDEVRLAIVKTGAKRPHVLELHEARAQYSEPDLRHEALVQAVRDLVGGIKRRPNVFVLCVSSEFAVVRLLAIPFKGARKVASAVPFELERFLAFPIEDFIIDYLKVMEIDAETEVLAAGIRRNILRGQLEILKEGGIDTHGVYIDATGLTGLWRACHGVMKGLHAVLHVRENHSVLAVTNNKSLVYFRHLAFPVSGLQENPAAAAQEVQNSLRAFHANWRGGGEVLSLTVTGAGLLEDTREIFEKEFDLPVSYEDLVAKLKVEKDTTSLAVRANHWEGAIGAALNAAGGGYSMNFRKEEFAPENKMAGIIPHLVSAMCLLFVVFAGIVFSYSSGQKRLIAEAAAIRDKVDAVQSDTAALETQGINVEGHIFSESPLLDILQEISRKMPDDKVTVTEVKMLNAAPGALWIVVDGEVKEDAAFQSAFAELKKSVLFSVDDDPGLTLEKGKSTFRIKIRKPEPGPGDAQAQHGMSGER